MLDLSAAYQQAQTLADAKAFEQFEIEKVRNYLRRAWAAIAQCSSAETLLVLWLDGHFYRQPRPARLRMYADRLDGKPVLAADVVRAAEALGVEAGSLAALVAEIARLARA